MKKKIPFLFIFILFSVALVAQEKHKHKHKNKDAHTHVHDSTSNVPVVRRAEAVLETVFKPEPGLNNADSIIRAFDNLPSFSIYKNNYIVTGTALGKTPDEYNSDAKFQISFMQRVTNSILPFRTYIFVSYTQLAYWNIYQESFPFGDINFNPTIGVGKALVYNNRLLGSLMLQVEHESNGRDSIQSRSWNKISGAALFKINRNVTFQAKAWIPFVDGENNKNIVRYKGWSLMALDYGHRKKFNFGVIVNKRGGGIFDANLTVNASFKMFKAENQYLFIEYYNGYGESLIDFDKYHHRARIGFVIKPSLMNFY